MLWMKKRFCDMGPVFYKISVLKEITKRHIANFFSKERIAKEKSSEKLPETIYSFHSNMIKRAPGVDLTTQYNKAENIRLACAQIHGILIHPGETFSFWRTVGKITRRKGYKEGRVITNVGLTTGLGGGLCNLGNSINRVILHSPLTITEFHKHSDALAPDEGPRIPLNAGTSVSYNYIDYRFKNNTDQIYQLLLWCEGEELFAELRAQHPIDTRYRLEEEDHHFRREGKHYYRLAKLYRITSDKATGEDIHKELIWDNHSKVMFDHSLIPAELICETPETNPIYN